MSRLFLVPVVCCALCAGCGKSDEAGPNAGGPDQAANQPQQASAAPVTNANTALGGAASAGASSSNPMTNLFRGLDRAAKRTGGGVQR